MPTTYDDERVEAEHRQHDREQQERWNILQLIVGVIIIIVAIAFIIALLTQFPNGWMP